MRCGAGSLLGPVFLQYSIIIDHLITRSVQIDDCDTLEHLCIIFAQAKKDICSAWTMHNTEIGLHTTHHPTQITGNIVCRLISTKLEEI